MPAMWLGRLSMGAGFIAVAMLGFILQQLVALFFAGLMFYEIFAPMIRAAGTAGAQAAKEKMPSPAWFNQWQEVMQSSMSVISIGVNALIFVGIWLYTQPEPRAAAGSKAAGRTPRTIARWSAIGWCILSVLFSLSAITGLQPLTNFGLPGFKIGGNTSEASTASGPVSTATATTTTTTTTTTATAPTGDAKPSEPTATSAPTTTPVKAPATFGTTVTGLGTGTIITLAVSFVLGLITYVLLAVWYYAFLAHTMRLAKRIPDDRLFAMAKRMRWLGPLLFVFLTVLIVGPIAALGIVIWMMVRLRRQIALIRKLPAGIQAA